MAEACHDIGSCGRGRRPGVTASGNRGATDMLTTGSPGTRLLQGCRLLNVSLTHLPISTSMCTAERGGQGWPPATRLPSCGVPAWVS